MSLASLPYADPGRPDTRSPARFLVWIALQQRASLALGMLWGTVWMLAQGAVPAALGAAVGAAATGDGGRTAQAALVVLGLGAVQTSAGVLRHRMAVFNWISSASRTQQLVVRQATRLGADLSGEVATGEVVAVSSSDVEKIGSAFDVLARFAGAVVAFVAVLVLLVRSSPVLAALTLLGAVLLAASLGPLLGPLERRERRQREHVGGASALAADTVAGLRVLRGVGGEEAFVRRYRQASQEVRVAAVGVARVRSVFDALQVLLPGLLLVAVTWVGALQVQAGSLGVGELVAFYAYAVFLVIPLGTFTEVAQKWTSAYVSARRVIAVLGLTRRTTDPADPARIEDPARAGLSDPTTGLLVRPGALTGVVCADAEAGPLLAARLGGDGPRGGDVLLGSVALDRISRDARRALVLVQDAYPALLSGTLAEHLDVPSSGRVSVEEAVHAAAAQDVLDAVLDADPTAQDVMSARITERGRSLSGGQRQRLALVRSLLADPPVLVLDEPTSAVDSHTEAQIGDGLREVRRGRTTVLVTGSPLLLDRCDEVTLVLDGRVLATGRHRDLMRDVPAYHAIVTREEVSA